MMSAALCDPCEIERKHIFLARLGLNFSDTLQDRKGIFFTLATCASDGI